MAICCLHPNLWYAQCHGNHDPFLVVPPITRGFLFSRLQISFERDIFCNFVFLSTREDAIGCYIDFSGFSTSWVRLAQECFLNTTCANRRYIERNQNEKQAGLDSWRRYLIAAPTLWLARAWC